MSIEPGLDDASWTSRHEHDGEPGADAAELLREVLAAEPGHHDVCQQQIDRAGVGAGNGERVDPSVAASTRYPRASSVLTVIAHHRLVFDEQHGLCPPAARIESVGMKLLGVCLVVSLCGCKNNHDKYDPDAEKKRVVKEKAEIEQQLMALERRGPGFAIKPEPLPQPEAKPGPAYLFVDEIGLAKLDGGKVTIIDAPLKIVKQIVIDKDMTPLVVDLYGVYRLVNGALELVGPKPEIAVGNSFDAAAIAPDGGIWVRDGFGVQHWDGSKWTKHEKIFGGDLVGSIEIDGKNRVYALSSKAIKVFDGGTWKMVWDINGVNKINYTEPPSLLHMFIVPPGELVVVSGRDMFRLDGQTLKHVERGTDAESMYPSAELHGTQIVGADDKRLFRVPLAGGPEKVVKLTGVSSPRGRSVVDAGGRIWMPTNDGFAVIAGDGTVASFPAGSIPEITATIQAIGVVGSGPELPTVGEIAKGSIRGTLTKAGAPIAKAYVEVCNFPRSEFRKESTPCSDAKITGHAETDGSGAFKIDNLPLLDYRVVIKVESDWFGVEGKACKGLAAGAVCDVGELDITKKYDPYSWK